MDLDTMRLEVRERIGELEEDFFGEEEIDRALNEALRRFSSEEHWPWLFTELTDTLLAADDTLTLPNNISINRVFNLSVDNASLAVPRVLERVDPAAGFRLRFAYESRTTTPMWYYLTSASVSGSVTIYIARVIPKPDINQSIIAQYIRVPALMTLPTSQPDCPAEYQEAIVAWASGKLFLKELDISQKASEQFGIYQKVLEQAKNDLFEPSLDENIAWGREHPGEVYIPGLKTDWVYGRIPPTLG